MFKIEIFQPKIGKNTRMPALVTFIQHWKPPTWLVEISNGLATSKKIVLVVPQNIKPRATTSPSSSTLKCVQKRFQKDRCSDNILCADVHIMSIHNSQKVETASDFSMEQYINKEWYIYTMDYYSTTKSINF